MQQVYLGKTKSGVYGYFTNGYLVWHLTIEDYHKPFEWHVAYAKKIGFEFIERPE